MSDLTGINGQSGYYALNSSLDLAASPFTASVVNTFSGTFTGLGHTISNLNINAPSTNSIGLFGTLTSTGTVRDIGLTGGTIYGNWYTGALVGVNDGVVDNAYSSVDMHVVYRSGGLVGHNTGTVIHSHATGSVTSNGDNGGVSDMGGLVGWNDTAGLIDQSYATGIVTGTANTTGGLVAYNGGGTISNSFATGGVFGNLYTGGLVGFGDNNGTISNSYSTGYVHANTSGGGLAGHFIGTISNSYWDTTTSGIASIGVGDGTGTGAPVGMTRTALQNGSLPTGFSSTLWATDSGLYPYLKSLFPTGMQSISGTAHDITGALLSAATLAVYIDGTQVGDTTAASGADGYYYLMATPGTVTGSTKIGLTETAHNSSTVSGLSFTDNPILTSGQVTGFDVTSGIATYHTQRTSYSAMLPDAQATFGSGLYTTLVNNLASGGETVIASGAFSIDQAISQGGNVLIQSGGDLTLASNGTVISASSGTAITLAANGSFINNAGSGAVSAANGRWLIYTQAHGMPTSAATANSFGGLNGKNYYNDAYSFANSSFASTPNNGNRFVTGYAPVLTVMPDTQVLTYNGAIQSATYSLTGYLSGDQTQDVVTGSINGLSAPSKNAGSYSLTASGTLASDENYGIVYGSGTLTIARASLTLAAVTDSKAYDATTGSTGTVSVTGLKGSDTVTDATQSFDSKNAGSRTLSVGDYTVNDGNSGGNYTVTTQTAAGAIAKAALTLAAATDSKIYDATTASTGTVSVTGLQGSDTVTDTTQSFDSKNAGSRTLSVGGYTVNDGNNGGNYTVTTQAAAGAIAKAALTLAAATDSKIYDATTASTGTVSVTGLKGSDTVTNTSQAFASKNAGVEALNITGYTVSDGNNGGNYTISTQTASGTIAKAMLAASLTGTTSKTYDSTLTATLTAGNYVLTGIRGSDAVTLNISPSGAFADANAGSGKTVAVSGLTLLGFDAGNYTVNTSAFANVGAITPRNITVTADNLGKNVGAADPLLTYAITFGSLAGSDALTGALSRQTGENPGVYDITQGSLAASPNYDVTFVKNAFTVATIALQNAPVVNPVNMASPPAIRPAPIIMTEASDAGSVSSDASVMSNETSGAKDASSASGDGDEKAAGPNIQTDGQSTSTCVSGSGCDNTPYPTNQVVSSSISFSSH